MANVVCIGRGSALGRHEPYLRCLGHTLHLVGSIDEYLRVTRHLGAEVVFVAESFDDGARRSVAQWVGRATPSARVMFLFEHHLEEAVTRPDRWVNVFDLDAVMRALPGHSSAQTARRSLPY